MSEIRELLAAIIAPGSIRGYETGMGICWACRFCHKQQHMKHGDRCPSEEVADHGGGCLYVRANRALDELEEQVDAP